MPRAELVIFDLIALDRIYFRGCTRDVRFSTQMNDLREEICEVN